jgi:integrase
MSLKQRGKYWHYEFMLHGERYWGSTRETVKSRAHTFESQKIADVSRGKVNHHVRRPPLLSEIAQDFLEYIGKRAEAGLNAPNTKRHYNNGWNFLSSSGIGTMRVDQITTRDAAVLKFPGGPWTARCAQQTLKRILNYASEKGVIQAAPRIPRAKTLGRSALIDSKMESDLLKHMETDVADLFVVMMDSGMRPDEVMRMEWSNVLWDRSAIFIPSGKTMAARRHVPLSDRASRILRARQQGNLSKWVFPGRTKEGRRRTVAKKFEAARAAAGIRPEIVLYCARHTFATNLLAETGDLALVQRVMGHESIATTQKYLHPETSNVADIVNRRNIRKSSLQLVKSA